MKLRFDMVGRFDGVRRTPQGGIQATANLTRVGVFAYHNADGTKTRELRHPDDVFKADSLATLQIAPITIGHPGMVTPSNYKEHTVGTVASDVRADGRFVKATMHVQDAEACRRVELGVENPSDPDALVEISCGYEVDVQPASGEYEGETFDSKQVGHRYNHVALGPANWGRAGNDVRLTLDEAGNARADSYGLAMTVVLKTDATPTAPTTEPAVQARLDALTGERDSLKADLESTKARLDAANAELVGAKALSKKLVDPARVSELVNARVALESSARAILGTAFTARSDKGEPLTDREIMLATIAKHDPKFDSKDRSDEYLRARFDAAAEHATKVDAAVVELGKATSPEGKIDALGESPLDAANKRAEADRAKATQGGAPAGSLVRKS